MIEATPLEWLALAAIAVVVFGLGYLRGRIAEARSELDS